ncbi:MAG: tripartite tricarboxylate transporter TctB family protein [Candidatus Accumulibacter sp.]|jgi:hypothetical protein|nr:tripartite tricarboxylate transporter TctB family protein [Accumulibacter sp.]
MLQPRNKDFIFSVALIALGVYATYEGYAIYQRAAAPPFKIVAMSVSPGLFPIILGIALIVLSLLLLTKSLIAEDGEGAALGEQLSTLAAWFPTLFRNRDFINASAGLAMMAVYVFGLVKNLPYWAASLIFLLGVFFFLRIGQWWKIIVISLAAVGGVLLLFQVIFRAALP